jgi:hypothetical protein
MFVSFENLTTKVIGIPNSERELMAKAKHPPSPYFENLLLMFPINFILHFDMLVKHFSVGLLKFVYRILTNNTQSLLSGFSPIT